MKNFPLLTLVILLVSSFALNAQVIEKEMPMSQGVNNAMVIELPDADEKMVKKLWKKFAKDHLRSKVKYVSKQKEFLIADASISGATDATAYAKIQEYGNDAELALWINCTEGYVSGYNTPTAAENAKSMLEDFALEVKKEQIQDEIDAEEKRLKKMEKDLKRLVKDNENFHDRIEKAKLQIAENEQNIVQNEKDQESAQVSIEEQLEVIKKVKKRLNDLR